MIVKDDFLNKLRRYFSLNLYEVKIWTALLSRGVSTAGELSDIANVPRSRSYDVLESLEKKGFVVMKVGKPIKYIAIPPREVLERVKKNVKIEADKNLEQLQEIEGSQLLEELDTIHNKGYELLDPVEFSGAVKDRENLIAHITKLIKNAEKEIILVTTKKYIQDKVTILKRHLEKAHERGIKIKIAAPIEETEETEEIKEISKISEIKNIDLNARFCIADRSELVFMLTEGNLNQDPALWVNTSLFAEALVQLFEISWKQEKATII